MSEGMGAQGRDLFPAQWQEGDMLADKELDEMLAWDAERFATDLLDYRPLAEWALLAYLPGYGVIDPRKTLVGTEMCTMYHNSFKASMLRKEGYTIDEIPDDTRFQGIGSTTEVAVQGERWPAKLFGQVGCMDTSVIPGRAPLLVAAPALEELGAMIYHGNSLLNSEAGGT